MARARDLSAAQIAFQVSGLDPDQLLVGRYRGSEGLSQLYRFEIALVSREPSVAIEAIVGKPAVLSIATTWGDRWIHGIVSRFEQVAVTVDHTVRQTHYRAEIVPALWLLTQRYQSRIFQGRTVLEIVSDVLVRAGLPNDYLVTSSLQADSYQPKDYCVQYRETDFNYVSRLLEEAGVFYHFEQTQTDHKMVLSDSGAAYAPIAGEPALPFMPPTGMNVSAEHVFAFRYGQEVRPGGVTLKDFNFEKPSLHLETEHALGRDAGYRISDYPGAFCTTADGDRIASLRAEELEAGRQLAIGLSNSPRLVPGKTFSLTEHPTEVLNREYVATRVTIQGRQVTQSGSASADGPGGRAVLSAHRAGTRWLYHGGGVNSNPAATALAQGSDPIDALAVPNMLDDGPRFTDGDEDPTFECFCACIPSNVVYRPPRVTPRPYIRGPQSARVVGPEGEEIQTDPYGRVKVQFNWDREGNEQGQPKLHGADSSCWIRVCQGMAGGAYGMMFLPRIGQEVVVAFEEGDPDKPIIIGRVYNADQTPPYELPAEKTKSVIKTHSTLGGGGSNEIRFEDLKDKEQLLLHAQKDLHIRVKNDRVENIDHNRHLTVKEHKYELVKKSKNSDVKLDFNQKVGGNLLVTVKGDIGEEVTGKHSEKVTTDYYLKADANIVIEAGTALTLKVGGNFVKIDSSGVTILGTKVDINCTGGSAGSGTAVELRQWAGPLEAATIVPGRDYTYSGTAATMPGEAEPELAGVGSQATEDQTDTSWIEIELVDEAGQPVPRERYEIIAPDGTTIKTGSLDQHGQAHVSVPDPGTCQVCFPDLDAAAWEGA